MTKYSNLSLESYNISVTDVSNVSVEQNITLERPSHLELKCMFTATKDLNSVNVTWKKDDELLETTDGFNTTKTGNTLSSQYRFIIFIASKWENILVSLEKRSSEEPLISKYPKFMGKTSH